MWTMQTFKKPVFRPSPLSGAWPRNPGSLQQRVQRAVILMWFSSELRKWIRIRSKQPFS